MADIQKFLLREEELSERVWNTWKQILEERKIPGGEETPVWKECPEGVKISFSDAISIEVTSRIQDFIEDLRAEESARPTPPVFPGSKEFDFLRSSDPSVLKNCYACGEAFSGSNIVCESCRKI